MTTLITGPRMRAILSTGTAPMIGHLSAYSNGLSGLIPSLFEGLDVVSRELVGMVPSVERSATAERAAVGQTTTYHVAPAATAFDITPSNIIPDPADKTIGTGTLTITKSRGSEFGFVGEEQRGLNANGAGYTNIQADLFAQALRVLTNEMEADGCAAAIADVSRATGTAGTTPFASGVGDSAQLRKILDDNGAPASNRSVVINTTTGAALRTNTQLTKANEAGTLMTLRQGELVDLHNLSYKESAQMNASHTKGTAASATTDATGYAVGATTITLASAGTGTIVADDVITFAGDPNKYLVVTGDADVSNGGTVVIAAPGLMQAIPASATAITVGDSYDVAGIGFSRDAIVLATRAPALPTEGDAAMDRFMLTDPRSGMSFEVSVYPMYRKVRYEVAAAWGWKVVKVAHTALLLG